jgi:Fe-S oxidoreductase/nitrate reductase gamma subunit
MLRPLLAEQLDNLPADLLSREVFGNISTIGKLVFYLSAALAVGVFAYGVYRRVRVWRRGKPAAQRVALREALGNLVRDVLGQYRFRARKLATTAHRLLFGGFLILFIGTVLIAIEHLLNDLLGREATNPLFHKGVYFGIYELTLDSAGIAFLIGCAVLLARRIRGRESFAHRTSDWVVLALLISIGVTGYMVEGLRILYAQTPRPGLSPVGFIISQSMIATGVDGSLAQSLHWYLWWLHAFLALGFIAMLPYTRLLHSVAGTVNLAIRDKTLGVLHAVDMQAVEETGTLGVGTTDDFTWKQLVELDACVSCGRCQDACPAYEAGKPLSPRNVVQDILAFVNAGGEATGESLHGDTIAAETLWSCTTCNNCTFVCPLGISPLRMITDMRRHLIVEGALRGSPATALQKTQRSGNPWGLPADERMKWAEGLEVPTVQDCPDFEILYWIGCAAAFDRRLQKVARSVVQLLQAADVKFAVLGKAERCTGEAARRMGDELLFQDLAEKNVATLAKHNVRRIVSHCPHCVNSFRNDYPQLGGDYEVVHHSQLLATLLAEGRIKTSAAAEKQAITYHDPCYLARVHNTVDEPRQVISEASGGLPIVELPRNGRDTACCGGGGGRMWFDDAPDQRIGQGRIDEVMSSGATTVAVSCPFCMTMISDGVAARKAGTLVRDIAELLAEGLEPEPSTGEPVT